jgi:hypothetical protein
MSHLRLLALALAIALAAALPAIAQALPSAADSVAAPRDAVGAPRDTTADADGYSFPTPPPQPPALHRHGPVRPVLGTIVGVAATFGPPAIAVALTRPEERFHSGGNPELIAGSLVGYLGGPALGLWSSGRPRRAVTGLALRGGGLAVFGVGLVIGNNNGGEDELEQFKGAIAALLFCGAGIALGAAGLGRDLYSLPRRGDTDEKESDRKVSVILRPDGRIVLAATF